MRPASVSGIRLPVAVAVTVFVALTVALPRAAADPGAADAAPGTTGGAKTANNAELRRALAGSPYEIVHESYRDGNWDLFVCRPDGTHERNLTRTPDSHEMYAQGSRDGSRIAFVADDRVDGQTVRSLYYMRRDGSGRTLIGRHMRQPCWSPDGKTIAYLEGEFSKFKVLDYVTKGVFFYDVATGKHRAHPNSKLYHLYNIGWSPDGRWLVATVHGGMGYGHAILAIEVAGDGVYDLKIGGCRPDISPDGKRLVWGRDDHTIAIADLHLDANPPRVSGVRALAHDEHHLYHSDWSPDGRFVVFSRGPGGRHVANGPGTNTGIAELVGVRAPWDLFVVPTSGPEVWAPVTTSGAANKEGEWLAPPPAAETRS